MSEYRKIIDNAWIRENSLAKINDLDCTIFDCDGTLVDVNNSYNACIKHTAGFILERILGGKQWYDLVTDELILKFRISGGFNNEIDTTYASIIAAIAAKTEDVELARKFVLNVTTHADERGIVSVEQYLSEVGFVDIVNKIKGELKYPGLANSSILSRAFDEFFYGKDLFVQMNRIEPIFNKSNGFIERDRVIISSQSIREIANLYDGRISIVSGRSRLATEYTLKSMLQNFKIDACVFIEDDEREVIKNKLNIQVSKPHPYALLKSMYAMNANSALCAGDSVEDMLMAHKASESARVKTLFCGVYGAVSDRELQRKVFAERQADLILENINSLPTVLTLAKE